MGYAVIRTLLPLILIFTLPMLNAPFHHSHHRLLKCLDNRDCASNAIIAPANDNKIVSTEQTAEYKRASLVVLSLNRYAHVVYRTFVPHRTFARRWPLHILFEAFLRSVHAFSDQS